MCGRWSRQGIFLFHVMASRDLAIGMSDAMADACNDVCSEWCVPALLFREPAGFHTNYGGNREERGWMQEAGGRSRNSSTSFTRFDTSY